MALLRSSSGKGATKVFSIDATMLSTQLGRLSTTSALGVASGQRAFREQIVDVLRACSTW